MATGAYIQGALFGRRAKTIVLLMAVVAIATAGFFFWWGSQPPTFEEQYRTLMGAELIANEQFPFERMSSPQSLEEAIELGRADIYGEFGGPGDRNLVVYRIYKSEAAALEAFEEQRAEDGKHPNFTDFGPTGTYAPHDYRVGTSRYARWATYKDNVIMLGESWRRINKDDSDSDLSARSNAMIRTAYKNYLRLLGP
jgi:hypothetical protein